MGNNSKTWSARILNAASKEESINNSVLRTRLRISKNVMDVKEFNDSVGRTTRHLYENKMLKRVAVGTYTITKKGVKALNNA